MRPATAGDHSYPELSKSHFFDGLKKLPENLPFCLLSLHLWGPGAWTFCLLTFSQSSPETPQYSYSTQSHNISAGHPLPEPSPSPQSSLSQPHTKMLFPAYGSQILALNLTVSIPSLGPAGPSVSCRHCPPGLYHSTTLNLQFFPAILFPSLFWDSLSFLLYFPAHLRSLCPPKASPFPPLGSLFYVFFMEGDGRLLTSAQKILGFLPTPQEILGQPC